MKGSEYDDIVVTTSSLEFLECGGDEKVIDCFTCIITMC